MQRQPWMADLLGVQALHLVAHTRCGFKGVVAPESARWLWEHVEDACPDALACCLMLDHLHLLVRLSADLHLLRRVLGHHGRKFGTAWDWAEPTLAQTLPIVRRTVRYIGLNALREGLVLDPLAWPWSTLRDLCGAVASPWSGPAGVAASLCMPASRLLPWLLSDKGSVVRLPQPPTTDLVASLDQVAAASASAMRTRPSEVQRRTSTRHLFIDVANQVASSHPDALARHCGITVRATRALVRRGPHPGRAAALMCLGDPRLRRHDV